MKEAMIVLMLTLASCSVNLPPDHPTRVQMADLTQRVGTLEQQIQILGRQNQTLSGAITELQKPKENPK